MTTYRTYLKTLRRVPDDIVLSVATRDLDLRWGQTCLCGWFVREAIGGIEGRDAAEVTALENKIAGSVARFGGTSEEWQAIYYGVLPIRETMPLIERAFVERVLECVS